MPCIRLLLRGPKDHINMTNLQIMRPDCRILVVMWFLGVLCMSGLPGGLSFRRPSVNLLSVSLSRQLLQGFRDQDLSAWLACKPHGNGATKVSGTSRIQA